MASITPNGSACIGAFIGMAIADRECLRERKAPTRKSA
jgi:hypothetical protein